MLDLLDYFFFLHLGHVKKRVGKTQWQIKMKPQMEQEQMIESRKTKCDNLRFIHQNTHNAAYLQINEEDYENDTFLQRVH